MDREDVLRLALDNFASDGLDAVREAAMWMAEFLSLADQEKPAPAEKRKMPAWTPERRAAQAEMMRGIRRRRKEDGAPTPSQAVRTQDDTAPTIHVPAKSKSVPASPLIDKPIFPTDVEVDKFVAAHGVKKVQSPEQVAEYLRSKGRRVVLRDGPLEKTPGKPHLPPSRKRIVLLEDREVPMSVLYTEANMLRVAEGLHRLDVPG